MNRILISLLFLGIAIRAHSQKTTFIPACHPLIRYSGRIDRVNEKEVRFAHTGVSFKIKFEGSICHLFLNNQSNPSKPKNEPNFYTLLIDDKPPLIIPVFDTDHVYKVQLGTGTHVVEVFKRTESLVGTCIFRGLEIENGKKLLPVDTLKRKIEFIGNSITCGYGNEGDSPNCHFSAETENGYKAYGAITARNLKADYLAVAYSGKGVIQNYELDDKETLPIIYDRIIPSLPSPLWDNKKWIPDAVVVNLGTNDFAHTAPDSALFVSTYVRFLEKLHNQYPKASLFCIEGCMTTNNWPTGIQSLTLVKRYINRSVEILHSKGIKQVYSYYPSSMEAGEIGCDWHPNLIRHQKMADEITAFLQEKMNW